MEYTVIPDRMEAATYALLALGTKGATRLKGVKYEHCAPWLSQLTEISGKSVYFQKIKQR